MKKKKTVKKKTIKKTVSESEQSSERILPTKGRKVSYTDKETEPLYAKVDGEIVEQKELKRDKRKVPLWKKKGFFTMKLKDRNNLSKRPTKTWLVTMRYSNGTSRTFTVCTNDELFKHGKRWYYLYYEDSMYDLSLDSYHLYFDEDICTPIKKELQKIGNSNYWSVNPSVIRPLIKFEFLKILTSGNSLTKTLRVILLIVILNMFATVIILFNIMRTP